ncbi:hypothetical protein AYL99_09927 [Fonsecaea erecta]|uniref:Uncharacterized protein n=1 Tax=Fonsecaea erecta TaxID=1367422 RepID=A0A178Z9M5_9EURO|nr:hypothetical protein AYL99_09927 [Fonsecaea erecta]OAP55775.1 hypothetical protein AYL99_09927 [Fonsecaea erecta]
MAVAQDKVISINPDYVPRSEAGTTITTTVPESLRTVFDFNGTSMTSCPTGVTCQPNVLVETVRAYPTTITVTNIKTITEKTTLREIFTSVIVEVIPSVVALEGICHGVTTSTYATPFTLLVEQNFTTTDFYLSRSTTTTTSTSTFNITDRQACTLEMPQPSSPPGPVISNPAPVISGQVPLPISSDPAASAASAASAAAESSASAAAEASASAASAASAAAEASASAASAASAAAEASASAASAASAAAEASASASSSAPAESPSPSGS